MASLDGISFDVTTQHVSRTILSSVGGFSQPARRNIRTLQDLLSTIRRFNLDVFESSGLRYDGFIGEGVSYKVSKCIHKQSRKLYAVKQVKLPSAMADFGAFERQVACVLRDVEVMSCLARHKNILKIFGYGWNIERGGVIPFLVTEFAAEGTLRAFLKNNSVSVHEKLLFCRDVAQGLHFLHVAGIAHGDLKLDNVLVTPFVSSGFGKYFGQGSQRTSGVEACLSDFGHSLHLYDDEGEKNVKQRYGGTLAYNAPEILGERRHARDDLNFRKCDVWSLGLLCWEVLIDGHSYFHNSDVRASILTSQQRTTTSPPTSSSINPSIGSSTSSLLEELNIIAPQLASISFNEVSAKVHGTLTLREIDRLRFLFVNCLEADHGKRLADIPLLPLLSRRDTDLVVLENPVTGFTETSWSFEIFEIAYKIPYQVREQIVNDCRKIANEPGDSVVTARAAFQLGFAYATGFGVLKNSEEAIRWFERSSAKGFQVAEVYLPVFRSIMPIGNVKQNATEAHNLVKERFLEANRRALKEKFATLFLEALQGSETASDPGSFYKSGFDLSTLSDKSDLDQQDENGNTNLIMACKFGRTTTVKWLTDHGVNKSSVDNVGCAALHWLFMFPEEDIDDISTRLSDRTDNVILPPGVTDSVYVAPFSVNHVALAPRPFSIDPQLPVYLAGTPLAFAVAVYCKQAVEAFILHLNADPLIGIYPWKQNMQNYSALHVAARLHMADILDFLLLHILVRKNSLPKSDIVYILNGLRDCMATATSIERTIIHGPHTVEAAEATVCTLQKYYDYVHERARTWKFLEPAIRKADLEVCSAILHAESAASDRPEQLFFESELVELMLACTSSACGIGPDTVLATRILEFATNVGASVDSMNDVPNITPHPPVFLVIEHHQSLLLDWFIEKQKVNLNVTDANGDTPLHAMITSGFSSTYGLAKLIQNGADPRLRNKKHLLPIQLALNDQMVNELITLLPFSDDFETQQLLEQAMSSNLPKAVTAIIQYAQGHHSQLELNLQSALSTAAVASSTRVTEALIAGGADPRKPDTDGISALHQAATFGNVDALLALIEGGADVNQRSYSAQANSAPISWSALVCSILCLVRPRQGADPVGARACCEELIKHGADVNCIDATGTTPLSYLLSLQSQDRNLELVECFLERGAQPGGPHAEPVLINAIIGHDYELAALLLKYKIGLMDIHNGMSVLHHCADIRLPEDITVKKGKFLPLFTFTQSLISAGCDLFKTDLWSRTPLDVAVQSKNGPLTFLLIDTLRETGNLQRKDLLPDPEEAAFIASLEHGKGNSRSRLISRFPKSSKPVDTPQTVNRPPTREASALIKAWRQAVLFKGLSTICAFIQADVHGPTTLLNRASCLSVLCYALEHEIGEIIIKFLGSLTRNPDATPDPYLSTIWQSIRPYLQATQFEALRKHNIFSRRRKNAISMADDAEIPSRLVTFASRLRYLDAIDGYSSLLPLEWLQSQGFYEAQRFSDFKECVISDSEAFSTWNTSTMQLPSILIFDDFEFGAGTVESENADISSSGLTRQLQLLQTLGTFGESHGVDSNYRRYDELYPHDTFKEVVSIEILYQEEEKDPVKLAEWEQVQNVLGTLGVFGETWQNGQCFKSGRIWVHQQLSFRYETAGMRQ